MSLINFPVLYIPDPVKGRPLFNGQIYIGEPDLDPQVVANQKQLNIIKGDGTVIAVAQPFSLSAGGVPSYNGNTVRLDVDGNYSIKILDKLGAQVYYIENVFEGEPVTDATLPALLINDLSQAYEFATVAEYKVFASLFPVGKTIHLNDRDADFKVITGNTTTLDHNIIFSSNVAQSIELISDTSSVVFKQWGAIGKNIGDDVLAMQAALDFVATVTSGKVDMGDGNIYPISKSLKGAPDTRYVGNSTIIASAGFTGVTLLDASQSDLPVEIKAMIYFVEGGKINDPVAPRRTGVNIHKDIKLNASSNAAFGVYADSYPACVFDCEIINVTETSVRLNQLCWNTTINGYLRGFGEAPIFSGSGCNGMDFSGAFIWGEAYSPNYGQIIEGDNNAFRLGGGTIEKVGVGVLCQKGVGPVGIGEMDFEGIDNQLIIVDGSTTVGRASGPVTIRSSFLESATNALSLFDANNAAVIIDGCRIKKGFQLGKTVGVNAYVKLRDCQNESALPLGTGNIIEEKVSGASNKLTNQLPNSSAAFKRTYEIENHSSSFSSPLVTSGLFFESAVQDVATKFAVSYAELFVGNELGEAINQRFGIAVNGKQGAKRVTPLEDNTHEFGYASLRWKEIFSGNGTINTSDERLKTELLDINEIEIAVAKDLKGLLKKYRFKEAVSEKGNNARIHFGVGAQSVIECFKSHGLDATKYSLLCYDEWEDQLKHFEEELDLDGNVIKEAYSEVEIAEGNRYGVRYDELLAFIIAAM